MKRIFIAILALAITTIISCSSDSENTASEVNSSSPVGAFTVSKSGNLTAQNGTPTKGKIEIGVDSQNTSFVRLGPDFTTELGTGTTSVYLSTSKTYTASPGSGNPDLKLIGIVTKNGEIYYKVNGAIENKFSYLIIWCGSANIPFGNGQLQ